MLGLGGGFVFGLEGGITGALMGGILAGLVGKPGSLARVTNPGAVLARDRRMALLVMLVGGVVGGFGFGLRSGGLAGGLVFGLTGSLTVGFGVSMYETEWPSYLLIRWWLALRGQLPWPLMSFLADAHRRGVLRQAGAVYQFRHIELQHRLANRDTDTQQANPPAARSRADE